MGRFGSGGVSTRCVHTVSTRSLDTVPYRSCTGCRVPIVLCRVMFGSRMPGDASYWPCSAFLIGDVSIGASWVGRGLALVALSVVDRRLDAVRAVLAGASVTEVAAGLGTLRQRFHTHGWRGIASR